jgi:hypothetical protein
VVLLVSVLLRVEALLLAAASSVLALVRGGVLRTATTACPDVLGYAFRVQVRFFHLAQLAPDALQLFIDIAGGGDEEGAVVFSLAPGLGVVVVATPSACC